MMTLCPYCDQPVVGPEAVKCVACGRAFPPADVGILADGTPSAPTTIAAKIADRYAPVYALAESLDGGAMIVGVIGGLATAASAFSAVTARTGIDETLFAGGAAFAALAAVMGWFTLRLGAALLRIAADIAVGVAPGLTDDERRGLIEGTRG